MSRPKSIYVVSKWSFLIFIFIIFIFIYKFSSKQTNLLFTSFLEYALLLLDRNVVEESKKFSKSKISASGCCL